VKKGSKRPEGYGNKKEFDWDILEAMCQRGMKMAACEERLGVSNDTIHRRIREKFGQHETFESYRDKKQTVTRIRLVDKALDLADAGNVTMLIFLLKNFCGFTDQRQEDATTAKLTRDLIIKKRTGDKEVLKA
jgi:hypothetical protein